MRCPECQNHSTQIFDSRPVEDNTQRWRRYECRKCGERFTTKEFYQKDIDLIYEVLEKLNIDLSAYQ